MDRHVPTLIVTNALMRRGGDVLLVLQQGPDDREPTWGLPGGMVEPGELVVDALRREVREETGLEVESPGPLVWSIQVNDPTQGRQLVGFTFAPTDWRGNLIDWEDDLVPADPDGLILEARFVPLEEAIAGLARVPWPAMREPPLGYLRGDAPTGTMWTYQRLPDGSVEFVARTP